MQLELVPTARVDGNDGGTAPSGAEEQQRNAGDAVHPHHEQQWSVAVRRQGCLGQLDEFAVECPSGRSAVASLLVWKG
jgi:hypothetical protein